MKNKMRFFAMAFMLLYSFSTMVAQGVSEITGYSGLFNFDTQERDVSVEINPENAGTIEGDGAYLSGAEITLTATASEGYEFANWTDGQGTEVHDQETYTFTMVAEDVFLIANFTEDADGLEDLDKGGIAVYPNPGNNVFKIASAKAISKIRLLNSLGRTVQVMEINGQNAEINISTFPEGMYFMQFYISNEIINKQVQIIR